MKCGTDPASIRPPLVYAFASSKMLGQPACQAVTTSTPSQLAGGRPLLPRDPNVFGASNSAPVASKRLSNSAPAASSSELGEVEADLPFWGDTFDQTMATLRNEDALTEMDSSGHFCKREFKEFYKEELVYLLDVSVDGEPQAEQLARLEATRCPQTGRFDVRVRVSGLAVSPLTSPLLTSLCLAHRSATFPDLVCVPVCADEQLVHARAQRPGQAGQAGAAVLCDSRY